MTQKPDMSSIRIVEITKEQGRRLRDARGVLKLTLREVSERTKGAVSPSRLSNYEQGLRLLKPREALRLAEALGVTAAYLLCVEGGEMTQEEVNLLRNWRALPENERNQYARRIEVLALAYREPVADERVASSIRPTKRRTERRTV
jgi:transcriptional regulator with XRE-family HTH domain